MATDPPARLTLFQRGYFGLASFLGIAASRVEVTSGRRTRWICDLALKDNAVGARPWVRLRHRRQQRFGVRMLRCFVERARTSDFHDAADIHHRHPVTYMF